MSKTTTNSGQSQSQNMNSVSLIEECIKTHKYTSETDNKSELEQSKTSIERNKSYESKLPPYDIRKQLVPIEELKLAKNLNLSKLNFNFKKSHNSSTATTQSSNEGQIVNEIVGDHANEFTKVDSGELILVKCKKRQRKPGKEESTSIGSLKQKVSSAKRCSTVSTKKSDDKVSEIISIKMENRSSKITPTQTKDNILMIPSNLLHRKKKRLSATKKKGSSNGKVISVSLSKNGRIVSSIMKAKEALSPHTNGNQRQKPGSIKKAGGKLTEVQSLYVNTQNQKIMNKNSLNANHNKLDLKANVKKWTKSAKLSKTENPSVKSSKDNIQNKILSVPKTLPEILKKVEETKISPIITTTNTYQKSNQPTEKRKHDSSISRNIRKNLQNSKQASNTISVTIDIASFSSENWNKLGEVLQQLHIEQIHKNKEKRKFRKEKAITDQDKTGLPKSAQLNKCKKELPAPAKS